MFDLKNKSYVSENLDMLLLFLETPDLLNLIPRISIDLFFSILGIKKPLNAPTEGCQNQSRISGADTPCKWCGYPL